MKNLGLEILSTAILSLVAIALAVAVVATVIGRHLDRLQPTVQLDPDNSINERLASRLRLAQNGRGTYR